MDNNKDDNLLVFRNKMVIVDNNECDNEVADVDGGDKKGSDSNDRRIFCHRADQYLTKYCVNYST